MSWSSQIVSVASFCVSSPQASAVEAVNCLKVCTSVCTVCVSKSEMTSQPDACWDSRPKEETVGGGKACLLLTLAFFFLPHCCCVAAASGFLLTLDLFLSAIEENSTETQNGSFVNTPRNDVFTYEASVRCREVIIT